MDLRVFIVTKNAPVHFALIDAIQETKSLCGALIQIDESCERSIGGIFEKFYADAKISSDKFFGVRYTHTANVSTLACKHSEFNNNATIEFIKSCNPNLIITFDTTPFTEANLSKFSCEKWNVHKGLSNKVKGADCHFWSTFLIDNEALGCTIHELIDSFNGGDIIHQTGVNIKSEDNVHDVSNRAMRSFLSEVPAVIELAKLSKLKRIKNNQIGKYFNSNEIKESHINMIECSLKELKSCKNKPKLFKQGIVLD